MKVCVKLALLSLLVINLSIRAIDKSIVGLVAASVVSGLALAKHRYKDTYVRDRDFKEVRENATNKFSFLKEEEKTNETYGKICIEVYKELNKSRKIQKTKTLPDFFCDAGSYALKIGAIVCGGYGLIRSETGMGRIAHSILLGSGVAAYKVAREKLLYKKDDKIIKIYEPKINLGISAAIVGAGTFVYSLLTR